MYNLVVVGEVISKNGSHHRDVNVHACVLAILQLQQSMAKSTERRVRAVSYVGETQRVPWYAIFCT